MPSRCNTRERQRVLTISGGRCAVIIGFALSVTKHPWVQVSPGEIGVVISQLGAEARAAQAEGEATFVRLTGQAEADKRRAIGLAQAKAIEALGLAKAAGFDAQVAAIGQQATAAVAIAGAVADGHIKIVPEVLVEGGNSDGAITGLAASLTGALRNWSPTPTSPAVDTTPVPDVITPDVATPTGPTA